MKRYLFIYWSIFLFFLATPVCHGELVDGKTKIISAVERGEVRSAADYFQFVQKERLSSKDICDTVDHFIDLVPTVEETNQFTERFGNMTNPTIYVALKKYVFAQFHPRSMDEFRALTKVKYPQEEIEFENKPLVNRIHTEIYRLVEERMSEYLALHPTIEEVNQLIVQLGAIEDASLYLKLKDRIFERHSPTHVRDFFAMINPVVSYAYNEEQVSLAYKSGLWKLTKKHVDLFLRLEPTLEECNELCDNHDKEDSATLMKVRSYVVNKTPPTTVSEFFKQVDLSGIKRSWGKQDAYRRTVFYEYRNLFFSLKPTESEIEQFISSFGYVDDPIELVEIQRGQFESMPPQTIDEFFNRVKSIAPPDWAGYREYRGQLWTLIQERLDFFYSLKPKAKDINRLISLDYATDPSQLVQIKRSMFEQRPPKTVKTFFRYISCPSERSYASDQDEYLRLLWELIEEKTDLFLALEPTARQVARLLSMWGSTPDYSIYFMLKKKYFELQPPKTASEFIRSFNTSNPRIPKEDWTVQEYMDTFLSLRPSISEILYLTREGIASRDVQPYMTLKEYAMREVPPKNVQEFIDLCTYALPSGRAPNASYVRALREFTVKHLDLFYSFKPGKSAESRLDEIAQNASLLRDLTTVPAIEAKMDQVRVETILKMEKLCSQRLATTEPGMSIQKHEYLSSLVRRHKLHFTEQLNQLFEERLAKIVRINLEQDKLAILDLINSLEQQAEDIRKRSERELNEDLMARSYPVGTEQQWQIPLTVADRVSVDRESVDQFIANRNQYVTVNPNVSEVECATCLEQSNEIKMDSCGHASCRSCYNTYIHSKIKEKKFPIPCFGDKCQALVSGKNIDQAELSEEEKVSWLENTHLALNLNSARCHREECKAIVRLNKSE